jgi:phage replication-related protein YjqB (UPF0714/DUF867 family)
VVVFRLEGLAGTKHAAFLKNLEAKGYISFCDIANVSKTIEDLNKNNFLNSPRQGLNILEDKIIRALS